MGFYEDFIKPDKLQRGDTIAVVSPSWGGPSVFPHVFDNGLEVLRQKFELKIREFPTARMKADKLHSNPKTRADDINAAFADKDVKAILASIGGDDSARILRYLDLKTIRKNPKIIMGYSDTSTLLTYLNKLGLVTFNGPAIMAGFSQMNNYPDYINHVKDMLFGSNETYLYKEYKNWSNKYPNWSKSKNVGKVSKKIKNDGWHWIQGKGIAKGRLWGGCIEVIEMMKGTDFYPNKEFWNGKILFFETSEEKPSPDYVKYALRNYGLQGVFDKISGILLGRARDYTNEEKKKLEDNVISVVSGEFGRPELPIVANMDFGHTEPQIILPLGTLAEINCKNKRFMLLESPLR